MLTFFSCFIFLDECEKVDCSSPSEEDDEEDIFDLADAANNRSRSRSLKEPSSQKPEAALFLQPPEDGALMASYSVFVVEPGSDVGKFSEIVLYIRCSMENKS